MADPKKIERVLELIESGSSERAACREAGINRATFRSAALRYGMGDQYARATEALARDQVEQLEIAIDSMKDGTLTPDIGRIEIDARKWIASKLFKPAWGDKTSTELTGANGGPIQTQAIDGALEKLTDEQLLQLAEMAKAVRGEE